MATQGVVTIRTEGQVRMKIIAGCDGMRAPRLADALREVGRVPTVDEAYQLAINLGFGDVDSLVVMNEKTEKFEGDEDLDDRYRRTFSYPRFNPRWENGTADNIEVVDL